MTRLSAPLYQLKRRAKALTRTDKIALHEALVRIARDEGFPTWSLLSARMTQSPPSAHMLSRLKEGELFLLGARPGHGKTALGLKILLDAARLGRRAAFFTLEFTERQARAHLHAQANGEQNLADAVEIVASDDIDADLIVRHLASAPKGSVAIVDYLQILDQRRSTPPLADQMARLQAFAQHNALILGFISQIDRSFDPALDGLPDMGDVRLPNAIRPQTFSKACFIHNGDIRIRDVA